MHSSLKVVTWVGRVKEAFGTLAFIGQSIEYRNYTSINQHLQCLPTHVMLQLYKTLMRPHFLYFLVAQL